MGICENPTFGPLEILPAMAHYAAADVHADAATTRPQALPPTPEATLQGLLLPPEHALRPRTRRALPHLPAGPPGRPAAPAAAHVHVPHASVRAGLARARRPARSAGWHRRGDEPDLVRLGDRGRRRPDLCCRRRGDR